MVMDTKDIKDNTEKQTIQSDIVLEIGSKMQKVVTALYMVTDLIPHKDPIRKDLRNRSVEALSLLSTISVKNSIQAQKTITRTQAVIEGIVNVLKTSVSIGFVSDMNFKLITQSLSLMQDDLNKKYGLLKNQDVRSRTFHNRAVEEYVLPTNLFEFSDNKTKEKTQMYKTSNIPVVSDTKMSDTSVKKSPKTQMSSNTREEAVIDLIQEKGEVSVSDVSLRFSEVSEKTIQRILVKLVESGRLQKTGEKRWSRYSIVS
jgi:hypothetical protein